MSYLYVLEAMNRLNILEMKLEKKAAREYQENRDKLLDCAKCHAKPEHSYDSFGMPFHRLECPKCHSYVEYPKKWNGVQEEWNNLQEEMP